MPGSKNRTAVYVYGIVPADVEVRADAHGVGDPPARVATVPHGEIAAIVSEVPGDHSLGTPGDLRAHARILDAVAKHAPVLPLRFGAVMTDEESVVEELLEAHMDEFLEALEQLEGRAEYIAKGRFVEESVIKAILEENPTAAQLRNKIRGLSEAAAHADRIALGELINNEIASRRDQHTQRAAETLGSLADQVSLRPPTHDLDAFQVACLAETARQHDLELAVADLADEWQNYVEVRLLGPLAPYDFVVAKGAES